MPTGQRFPIYWRICRTCGERYRTKSRNRSRNRCDKCKEELIQKQKKGYMRYKKRYFRTCRRCGKNMWTAFRSGKICPKCSLVPLSRYVIKGKEKDKEE